MIISFISFFVTYVCILLGLAFFTLLERKGLGYMQVRKGPNKVGIMGLPQPLADAAKLLTKEMSKPEVVNQLPYFIAPILSLILALMLWQLFPSNSSTTVLKLGLLFFLCVSSMNVYGTLLAGWGSNSKYALLGAVRAIAQTISYEVSMALILLFSLFLSFSLDLLKIEDCQNIVWYSLLFLPMSLVWFVSCIAETNRAPFDFAEGETELVSGFNVEYGAGGFALIFMAEYANILLMSLLTGCLFFGGPYFFGVCSDLVTSLKALFFCFVFIWARATLPRFRYDLLMGLTWKSFLPLSLSGLSLLISVFYIFDFS
uniref:NADH dehydrogenase subunit 1 n=1 Tax=Lamellomphalus manusensis TaxID=2013113 RepID=UPI0021CCC03D|nr:NADH dehydrogenase subunit 1 [Lamellomphalus manusensis]UGY86775.1 NADH dehydrogenase subunit 1 [Lamellomphalus manusensis]UWT52320.1 NADH dehydrogenase subunit 1 [Lamellomphalus manusensis]